MEGPRRATPEVPWTGAAREKKGNQRRVASQKPEEEEFQRVEAGQVRIEKCPSRLARIKGSLMS